MDCSRIDQVLNDYLDDALTPQERMALEQHCQNCAECAGKLRSANQMLMLFSELSDEPEVPLKTQAAWRTAVRAEAGRHRQRRFMRMAGGIAAALVVAVGATLAVYHSPGRYAGDAATMPARRSVAMIEADGRSAESAIDAAGPAAPMHEYTLTVDDIGNTCDYVSDLVREYEGRVDPQRFEQNGSRHANLYIEVPAENAADFIEAIGHFSKTADGAEAFSIAPGEGEWISILLVLEEN